MRVGNWIKNDRFASVVEWRDRDSGMLPQAWEWVLVALAPNRVDIGCRKDDGVWIDSCSDSLNDEVRYWAPLPPHLDAEGRP